MDIGQVISEQEYVSLDIPVAHISSVMLEDTPVNRAALSGIVTARYIPEGTPFVKRDLELLPEPAPAALIAEAVPQELPRPPQVAEMLRPGMRAIALPVSANTAVAGLITRGDRVDVLTTYLLPTGEQAARIVITNVRVIATDRTLDQSGELPENAPQTVTLELHPEGVKMLALAMQTGAILLVLTQQDDDGMPEVANDTPMLSSRITALEGMENAPPPKKVHVFRGSKIHAQVLAPEVDQSLQPSASLTGSTGSAAGVVPAPPPEMK